MHCLLRWSCAWYTVHFMKIWKCFIFQRGFCDYSCVLLTGCVQILSYVNMHLISADITIPACPRAARSFSEIITQHRLETYRHLNHLHHNSTDENRPKNVVVSVGDDVVQQRWWGAQSNWRSRRTNPQYAAICRDYIRMTCGRC